MKKVMERVKNFKCPDVICVLLLIVYSMRHVHWGLDWLDTGYSYINFQYMGYEHMDTMWLFSTYLANVVGNMISKLPFANLLLGMNFYTTLFVAALAIVGYFFCTRVLKISRTITFAGEFIALSLCWCPSSVLYNYLSYLLLAIAVVLLYKALTEGKKKFLFLAGICLGVNVLTRFSNLAQAALILAVWAYGALQALQNREKGMLKTTLNRTFWCIAGYLTGILPLLGYIHIRYGLDEYVTGIVRLFSMTESATDYQPNNMLLAVLYSYYENIYWVIKMVCLVLIGMCIWMVVTYCKEKIEFVKRSKNIQQGIVVIAYVSSIALAGAMLRNFYVDGLCDINFYWYDSIRNPSVLFMMLTMMIAFIKLIHKNVAIEEKLVGILIVLIVFISSLGSNNGIYSSLNNLFFAAPYTLWNCCLFIREVKDISIKRLSCSAFPIKAMLIAFLLFYGFQTMLFGYTFFYTEATGAKNVVETVEGIEILDGIKMSPEKAEEIVDVYNYVQENHLQDRETIVVGHIPSIAYYLQMPPAFNSWLSLDSYPLSQMQRDMEVLQEQVNQGEIKLPVIITSNSYMDYDVDLKWAMLMEFMDDNGYRLAYNQGEFAIYQPLK